MKTDKEIDEIKDKLQMRILHLEQLIKFLLETLTNAETNTLDGYPIHCHITFDKASIGKIETLLEQL